MAESTQVHRVVPDESTSLVAHDNIKRVVFCSGMVYFELAAEREARGINDIALVRVEQFELFPFEEVAEQAALYSNAEIVWAQEEPHNTGFWTYLSRRIENALAKINGGKPRSLRYVAAAPESTAVHQIEHLHVIDSALA